MAAPADFGGAPANPVGDAFEQALRSDAQAAQAGQAPAPPRITASSDPEAPHGRGDDGKPLAPFGFVKGTERPRIKPAGPGRGGKDDAPRTAKAPAVAAGQAGKVIPPGDQPDFREDLSGLAMSVWIGGAMLPPTRPYAYLFRQAMPGMVEAWNAAAQQNAAVRAQVEKWAGEGSYGWVLRVSITTVPFLVACAQLASTPKDPAAAADRKALRADLAARSKADLDEYMQTQMADSEPDPDLVAA